MGDVIVFTLIYIYIYIYIPSKIHRKAIICKSPVKQKSWAPNFSSLGLNSNGKKGHLVDITKRLQRRISKLRMYFFHIKTITDYLDWGYYSKKYIALTHFVSLSSIICTDLIKFTHTDVITKSIFTWWQFKIHLIGNYTRSKSKCEEWHF